mmetsp:Transcript_93846/g.292196  ORF Transcript_93846/g.292196 Transcript_93846/m.292196 type:complete len:92 (-) Transcript_93846:546-821(-)
MPQLLPRSGKGWALLPATALGEAALLLLGVRTPATAPGEQRLPSVDALGETLLRPVAKTKLRPWKAQGLSNTGDARPEEERGECREQPSAA